jgi:hypothetical protein
LPKNFQKQFLEEILTLGPKVSHYSKSHFDDYLKMFEKHEISIFDGYGESLAAYRISQ